MISPMLMKAMVYERYGGPEALELRAVEKPVPDDDEVLIKVHATALNASDWELLRGRPLYTRLWGLTEPKFKILGSDVAGRIETVGSKLEKFKPGDYVLGDLMGRWGGLAEYVCASQHQLIRKPAKITFKQAAAMPQAGSVALQGLRDKGRIQTGQDVLIIGAGGGAGSFAIQLAKLFGARVTAIDNAGKLEFMRALGADRVIDYIQCDYAQIKDQYDLILDFVAPRSVLGFKRLLRPGGRYVLVGGSVPRLLQTLVLGPVTAMFGNKRLGVLAHRQNPEDLAHLVELCEAGKVEPFIDRTYPLSDVPAALRYLGAGRANGKILITMES